MAEKKRMANYELLRLVSMMMVVVLHFLSHSDRLLAVEHPIGGVRLLGSLIEAFCLVAVNTFVMLSGYLGVNGNFRIGKAFSLYLQILFYSLLIPLVLTLLGAPTEIKTKGFYGLIQYVFPIEAEHYWFATSYFLLYLISPALNAAVRHLPKKKFQVMLAGLLLLFCGVKSVVPVYFPTDHFGYDLPWFICVYLTAAYFSLYGFPWKKRGWLIYVVSCLLGFGINLLCYFPAQRVEAAAYYFTVPYHYNFIFNLTGAVGLFFAFSCIKIKGGKGAELLCRLGTLSFGIYLLHEHIDLRDRWYEWIQRLVNPLQRAGTGYFLLELLASVVILFAAGLCIDFIRSRIFLAGKRGYLYLTRNRRKGEADE